MVHRHSLTFRHSQGEAHMTSRETRNEQANQAACLGSGQSFSPPWGSPPRHQRPHDEGAAAAQGGQPRLEKLQGPLTSLTQDTPVQLPRAPAPARVSSPGCPSGSRKHESLGESGGGGGGSRPGGSHAAGAPLELPMGLQGGGEENRQSRWWVSVPKTEK